MKKMIMTSLLLTLSFNSFADKIECFNKKTKERVMFIADDMGSVTVGGLDIGTEFYSFENLQSGKNYSYYYGQYLMVSAELNHDRVEVAAVHTRGNTFEGKVAINPTEGDFLIDIICHE